MVQTRSSYSRLGTPLAAPLARNSSTPRPGRASAKSSHGSPPPQVSPSPFPRSLPPSAPPPPPPLPPPLPSSCSSSSPFPSPLPLPLPFPLPSSSSSSLPPPSPSPSPLLPLDVAPQDPRGHPVATPHQQRFSAHTPPPQLAPHTPPHPSAQQTTPSGHQRPLLDVVDPPDGPPSALSPQAPSAPEPAPATATDAPSDVAQPAPCFCGPVALDRSQLSDDEVVAELLRRAKQSLARGRSENSSQTMLGEDEEEFITLRPSKSLASRPCPPLAPAPLHHKPLKLQEITPKGLTNPTRPALLVGPKSSMVLREKAFLSSAHSTPNSVQAETKKDHLDWHELPRQEVTPEVKREIQAMRLHRTLDPKAFVKGGLEKSLREPIPERFLFGHLVSSVGRLDPSASNTVSGQGRGEGHLKKRSFVESLMEDERSKDWSRQRYLDQVQVNGASGGKNFYKRLKADRQR